MEKLYDNFPHRNIKLHTYSKSNTIKMNIYTINIKREDFPMHLMQHLSHNLRKKTFFRNPKLVYYLSKLKPHKLVSLYSIKRSYLDNITIFNGLILSDN